MPDHAHLIFTPLYDGDSVRSVALIVQRIKGASPDKDQSLAGAHWAGLAARIV